MNEYINLTKENIDEELTIKKVDLDNLINKEVRIYNIQDEESLENTIKSIKGGGF